MTQTDEYSKARTRAEVKYGFYVHAIVYAAVMALLIIINLMTAAGTWWFVWPLMGWGIAIAIHAARVYLKSDKTVILDALTERELRKVAGHKTN